VIQSFRSRDAELIYQGIRSRRLPGDFQQVARRKLLYLDQATTLTDLRVPPGNQLEALKGERAGQHSIRINDQWRICFVWGASGPEQVEIVDYH
jgi:proteic killer suppression protein